MRYKAIFFHHFSADSSRYAEAFPVQFKPMLDFARFPEKRSLPDCLSQKPPARR